MYRFAGKSNGSPRSENDPRLIGYLAGKTTHQRSDSPAYAEATRRGVDLNRPSVEAQQQSKDQHKGAGNKGITRMHKQLLADCQAGDGDNHQEDANPGQYAGLPAANRLQ